MPFAQKLDVECDCGESPSWWSEDETEDTIEVYVTCYECGHEYPKKFVSKSEDTSADALREIARDIVQGSGGGVNIQSSSGSWGWS